MKVLWSKETKKKFKDTLKDYFELLYPEDYSDALVSKEDKPSLKEARRKVSVPLSGVVKQTEDGFVYVDVSNDVIHGLFQLIDEEGIEKPPYFEERFNGVGAHITITNKQELGDQEFKDVGKEVTFKLGKMYSIDPLGWEDVERVWFVEVFSSDIENLRKKYGLRKRKHKKGKSMEFHITIAVRRYKNEK